MFITFSRSSQFLLTFLLLSRTPFTAAASAQLTAPAQASALPPSELAAVPSSLVQPALASVQQSLAQLTISRWKAPKEVRAAQQSNADSIGRDLATTLPSLLSRPDAGSVPGAFAIYRNLDALYDVLLRISQTASLSAPPSQAASIVAGLQQLESARTQLGDAIQQASQQQQAEIARLQSSNRRQATAPAAAPAESTIVDDGPATTTPHHRKRKPAAKTQPAPATQPSAPAPQ